MKRIIIGFCILGIFSFIVSCVSNPSGPTTIFDENLSAEKSTTLWITKDLTVTRYNGIDINLTIGDSRHYKGFTIPAGNTELVMDLYGGMGYTIIQGKDIVLRYNFDAGEQYLITFTAVNEDGKIPVAVTDTSKIKLGLVISTSKDWRSPVFFVPMESGGERETRVLQ